MNINFKNKFIPIILMNLLCLFPVVTELNASSTVVYVKRILKSLEGAHIDNTP